MYSTSYDSRSFEASSPESINVAIADDYPAIDHTQGDAR